MPEEAPTSHPMALYVVVPISKSHNSASEPHMQHKGLLNLQSFSLPLISLNDLFCSLSHLGPGSLWSSADVETLASKKHKYHPLWQSCLPENHWGWAPHLQEQLRGLHLSSGIYNKWLYRMSNAHYKCTVSLLFYRSVYLFFCRGKCWAWRMWMLPDREKNIRALYA